MASGVRVYNGKFANVQGADVVQQILASIPAKLAPPVQAAVDAGGDELAAQAKAIAPVAPEFERHPGELRDSVRREANGRALSTTVLADAVDQKGEPYAAHVEYGHKTPGGGHAAPVQFFWPSYQVKKRSIRARIQRAVRDSVKASTS